LREGLDNVEEHQVLEALLYYAIPRLDTNEIAHRLLKRFGSLHRVFDATTEELCEVEGIGANSAFLLAMVPGLARRYMLSRVVKSVRLSDSASLGDFLMPYFIGKRDEVVYMLCLNSRMQPISCEQIHSGSVNAAFVSIPNIIREAVKAKATYVVIAHNHPGGFAIPSKEDMETTLKIYEALRKVNIMLLDHIIVSDPLSESAPVGEFVSLSDSGVFFRQERKIPIQDKT
jgi:DNA repair protein RadC